jgi:hypothetical protein
MDQHLVLGIRNKDTEGNPADASARDLGALPLSIFPILHKLTNLPEGKL